ncbi:hypothetical protein DFS34DRAFT_595693 [Phlyctochytrium arcticum]|nr:hypothetical protein DFS34DRAFT_595693 [Phlyctochytrium arcticum]
MAGSRLPTEILAKIAGEIDDEDVKTLLALSSVSHTWHQLSQPTLYRSIYLLDSSGFPSQLQLLLKTVEKKPHLASFIRKLDFSRFHAKLFAEIASLASLCANLKRLDLGWTFWIQDPDLLGILEKCKSLEELSIATCCKITSKGFIKALPFLKNLRKLDLHDVTAFDLDCYCEIAKMCPLLEYLDLGNTSAERTKVLAIMALATNLKFLDLWSIYKEITPSDMRAILKGRPSHLTIAVNGCVERYNDLFVDGSPPEGLVESS